MPVLNETIPFEKAFPDLFVPPELHFEKQTLSYDEFLKQYSDKNLVILGDAGSGKSTLLKFISQFENVHAVYFTAQALKDNDDILKTIEQLYSDSHEDHLFLLVDSLDEAYWNDMSSYKKLINTLTRTGNAVNVWLASRKDFYQRTYSESTTITFNIAELWPWKDEYSIFLDNWAKVFKHKKTPVTIKNWAAKEPAVKEMLTNPFQLTLLAYLADTSDDLDPMTTIYDLYDKFFLQWFKKEELRGTGATNRATTISQLHDAANNIYAGKEYTTSQLNDTAVTNLLLWNSEEMDLYGNKTASMFRHHSLAAFLIAHQIMHAIQRGDNSELTKMLQMVIKDDVTNFVIRKAEQMKSSDIKIMRNHLASYYKTLPPNDKGYVNVKEKVIYYISRFPGDSSSFLLPIVRTAPENPYMRLTLAYACSLSEEKELRYYALEYARSLSHNEEDARVNRGWTVVYFGDCNKDPYTYRDEENGPWANARAARIKRFTKKKPRIKDYRFWLFDLPLFHTFLKSRNWADINSTEFEIIKKLTFPKDRFTPAEIRFLWREKKAILKTYEIKLKKTTAVSQEE